jgi:hypothetical protein
MLNKLLEPLEQMYKRGGDKSTSIPRDYERDHSRTGQTEHLLGEVFIGKTR